MSNHERKYLTGRVTIQVTEEDLQKLEERLANSTCRTMSEYGRKLLLGKPVTVLYRNRSLDAFIDEAIALRTEMQQVRKGLTFSKENEIRLILLHDQANKCIYKIFEHVCQNKS
jgi:hypothetical protein